MAWNQKIMRLSAALDGKKSSLSLALTKEIERILLFVHKPNDGIQFCT